MVGIVAIGRNEGERLRRCLQSLAAAAAPVCYVDSGSTDGSRELAASLGADVVPLDLSVPFTAARARNAGWRRLLDRHPDLAFVFFLDGDCELDPGFLPAAQSTLAADSKLAAVCGRRRERFPERSVYNRLCDLEWDTPVGRAEATGGDAVFRVSALRQASGYRDGMIAGEEPELCTRLQAAGWQVERIDAAMTLHDADMHRFGQWWRRSVRAGHANAEGAALHPTPPYSLWVRERRSNWLWGLLFPAVAVALAWPTWGLSLALLATGYGVLTWRVFRYARRRAATADAWRYAAFTVLGKLPCALGQLRYLRNRATGRASRLIEYKTP